MRYTQAEIDDAQRLSDDAQAQVNSQARLIVRMKASDVSTVAAESALRTMIIIRDQMLARLKAMQRPLKVIPGTS